MGQGEAALAWVDAHDLTAFDGQGRSPARKRWVAAATRTEFAILATTSGLQRPGFRIMLNSA